jgi:ribonuclease P protein component
VLPAAHRVTDAASFREATRRGRRAAGSLMVVHLVRPQAGVGAPPRVGFVVSKAVGNSVVRNRVQRRLRHLVRPRLSELPGGAVVVVRALPASAASSSADLARDLDRCLTRVGVAAVPSPGASSGVPDAVSR